MKAYMAQNAEGYVTLIYAENPNKAKTELLYDDMFDGYEYTEIRVKRAPRMDKYYNGKERPDWDNSQDRIALVKELGWYCQDESGAYDFTECETCPAREFCDPYNDVYLQQEEE